MSITSSGKETLHAWLMRKLELGMISWSVWVDTLQLQGHRGEPV